MLRKIKPKEMAKPISETKIRNGAGEIFLGIRTKIVNKALPAINRHLILTILFVKF